ncbi:putative ABC transport system permease protein [Actinopolyspora lacussalsi subsp. righensis]|uniref:Putative ABC transport system permease protein n=1 Tax=Actinopolyspora righensis TaxID=995060 RepID=A0A1I6Y6F6_9ACTN|nr:FtsX-like permease family protein [Actinopolyspora righensis]SFT45724.1 putative ABC transport system permease protein [Actinopolyspora righensis]
MLRNTLLQLRHNIGRLSAAGLAIVLGVGFVAATLVFTGTMQSSVRHMVAAPNLSADVVVTDNTAGRAEQEGDEKQRRLREIRETGGVAAAVPRTESYANASWAGERYSVEVSRLPEQQSLRWYELARGNYPGSADEVVLSERAADSANISPGDTITLQQPRYVSAREGETEKTPPKREVTVSGLVDVGSSLLTGGSRVTVFAPQELLNELGTTDYRAIDLLLADGADTSAVLDRLRGELDTGQYVQVRTGEEQAEYAVRMFSGSVAAGLNAVLLPFGAIALFVAGFVIVNTFSVLHAQRSRQYALLRCVGATRGQIRRSALFEALLVGLVTSVIGTVFGVLVSATVSWPLGLTDSPVDFGSLGITPLALTAPVAAGLLVTFLASLAPAARAMRVAPLAALRPVPDEQASRRIGRARLVSAVVCTVLGAGLLFGGALLGSMAMAVPGGLVAVLGVLLFTPTLIPAVARAFGYLLRSLGPTGTLASGNAVRNPYRASSTSTALMIGVGLIVLLLTGTASARHSANEQIDQRYPVDVKIAAEERGQPVPEGVGQRLAALDGTAATAVLSGTGFEMERPESSMPEGVDREEMAPLTFRATGIEPAKLTEVSRHGGQTLRQGTALVNKNVLSAMGWSRGERVELPIGDGSATFRLETTKLIQSGFLLTRSDLAATGAETSTTEIWARATSDTYMPGYTGELNSLAEESASTPVDVGGAVQMRAQFTRVLDTLLLIVTGLLAVAVIIAVVGIANTLGLSVLERGRESALLRALGLTRGQLRGTLALEAVLLAVVGTVLGALVGVLFAFGGVAAMFENIGLPVSFAVPWARLLLVIGCAIPAGVLASVLPARRAAKAQPAAALSEE